MVHVHKPNVERKSPRFSIDAGIPNYYCVFFVWRQRGRVVKGVGFEIWRCLVQTLCFLCLKHRANTKYIDKYNLLTNSLVAQITLNGYSPRQAYYQWGGHSGVDLAVDEQGLWVFWGNSGDNKRLYASKIDNDVIVQTHSLSNGESKKCVK